MQFRFRLVASLLLAAFAATACADDQHAENQYTDDERGHWSLVPVVRPELPELADEADRRWLNNPIDAFVLAGLRQNELAPAPRADRRTLVRRVYFQITGLPPSPADVADFLADDSPDAYERLIDRLLAAPRYGEQWGQRWLDVVRFAETEGFEYDNYRAGAWRFRDYVIRSANADKPFDRFVTEQLAGDELAASEQAENARQARIAAGFHRLGPVRRNAGNAEVAFSRNEVLTERTDIIGAALLGLTIGCARCHDHMFDPIRQADYYGIQAFLAATYEDDIPLADAKAQKAWQARADAVDAEVKKLKEAIKDAEGDERERLQQELEQAQARAPQPLPTISSVKNDAQNRTAIHLLQRGDPAKKLAPVGMSYLGVVSRDENIAPAETPRPKLTLARWITSDENPLTARVIVNRLWAHHFGTGLVSTTNDFGVNGDWPSHPELLDFLASELVRHEWRLKPLHRLILTSNTFRQASHSSLAEIAEGKDPDNRLLWRFSRRRLQAHELRDALLCASGQLNLKAGGPSVIPPVDPQLVELLYKPSQWKINPHHSEHRRRSIYLIAKRNLRLPFMEVFDQPDLQTSCGCRESSTHPPQSLELLNGELSNELADAFAARLSREAGQRPAAQVELAFRIVAGREPTAREQELGEKFLADQPLREFALAMFNLNAFLYVQ